MVENFILEEKHVRFIDTKMDWEAAVTEAAGSLLEAGYIEAAYIDGMIASIKEHGPYIVIAPNIALPHARPEMGSKKIGFNVTLFEHPVDFTEDGKNSAQLLITLSCVDDAHHLEMLQSIVMVLSDEDKQNAIFSAKTPKAIVDVFA